MKLIAEIVFSQTSLPIGTIIPYAGDLSKIPYGWHLCDGTNGTPDLSGRFLEGTTNAPKTFKDAGLPNITGYVSTNGIYVDSANGAFRPSANDGAGKGGDWTFGRPDDFAFNASWSNSIYGASDTVQPKSYTVYYIMRVK